MSFLFSLLPFGLIRPHSSARSSDAPMQEIVASGNFVLYVRCLEECGVQGATISIFLNEQFHPDPAVLPSVKHCNVYAI